MGSICFFKPKTAYELRIGVWSSDVCSSDLIAAARLTAYVELKPLLGPPLMGWASASYADMHAQLAALVYPGFLRETPEDILPELPRYLRALAQRAERVRLDPQRDRKSTRLNSSH